MHAEIPVLTVSQLTYAIKSQLEPTFHHILVRGEVSNFRKQSSGHLYFSLVEGGCQLSAVLFRSAATHLESPLKDGDTILAEGELNVYPPKGNYQIVIRKVSQLGLGAALLRLQELKRTLQRRGWFAQERKRPLPKEIRTIGVVTSPTGAVLRDIINVLSRRLGAFHLLVNPVRVQGEGAAQEIAKAINELSTHTLCDVIIICRGGGSAEDLSPFNEEIVAKACFDSSLPVISAVGHETDLSIADLVADIRAPTPSAAAELVSKERSELRERLSLLSEAAARHILATLKSHASHLSSCNKQLALQTPQAKIEESFLRLDDLEQSLRHAMRQQCSFRRQLLHQAQRTVSQQAPLSKLAHQRHELRRISDTLLITWKQVCKQCSTCVSQKKDLLGTSMQQILSSCRRDFTSRKWLSSFHSILKQRFDTLKRRIHDMQGHFHALHPQRTLERGYAIVFRKNSQAIVRSVQSLSPEEELTVRVADGTFSAKVCEVIHR